MKFLWVMFLWRWHAFHGKRLARAASRAHEMAAHYRDRAYADAAAHAERVALMRRPATTTVTSFAVLVDTRGPRDGA